jgi:uncharacterized protein YtpQ (UPF0354 family)
MAIFFPRTAWRSGLLIATVMGLGVCRADELTDNVLQAFESQASAVRATAKSDDELQVSGRKAPLTVYLYNVRAACASNKERCDDEIASFVRRVSAVASADEAGGAFSAEKVYPVLRSAGFGKRAAEAFKEPNKQLIVLPFVDSSIEVLFAIDGEQAVRFVNREDVLGAGLTEVALLELASRNAARLPALKYEPLKGMDGVFFMPSNDGLGTARAFDAALWDKVSTSAGGPVALAVPTRDWILFTRADQAENVANLRLLAGRIARGEPYPVSAAVIARVDGQWKALPAR